MYRIIIPAGKPPFVLPTSNADADAEVEVQSEPPTEDQTLFEAIQSGEKSGLLDNASALSSSLGAPPSPKSKSAASSKPERVMTGGGVPSDDEIVAWAKRVREHGRKRGSLYKNSALKYWVRYTFRALTPEYKAVGERIDAVVEEV